MSNAPVQLEQGDAIHPGHPVAVNRYAVAARLNHWVTALSFVALVLSGLALFSPSFYFLSGLFGGGQLMRALHPIFGVVLVLSFTGLFFRFWRANLPAKEDSVWLTNPGAVLSGHEEKLPEIGKYNAGQKAVFWSMTVLILVMLATGIPIWDQYFAGVATIEQQRIAVWLHSMAAIGIICVWIIHVYAAFWVKGTLDAMVGGTVTGGWAWRHHRKWLRELVKKSARA